MVEHNGLTAYLSFPADRMTKGILLQETRKARHLVEFRGKIREVTDEIPNKLALDMQNKGAHIVLKPVNKLTGRKGLFGVDAESTYDGKDLIRIRIVGSNLNDMVLKIQQIKNTMSKFGYEPKQCVWDRVGRYQA